MVQIQAAADYLQVHPSCLRVLDNVEDPQQLRRPLTRFLLPAALPCALLFTTRRQDLGGFRPVELPVLTGSPALPESVRRTILVPFLVAKPVPPESVTV